MKAAMVVLVLALGLPGVLHAQGQTTMHAADPAKPRDGFGFAFRASFHVTGGVASMTTYPVVTAVQDSTPAKIAGIEVGDVVLSADGTDLTTKIISLRPPRGTRMILRIKHGDAIRTVTLVSVRLYTPPDSIPPG